MKKGYDHIKDPAWWLLLIFMSLGVTFLFNGITKSYIELMAMGAIALFAAGGFLITVLKNLWDSADKPGEK